MKTDKEKIIANIDGSMAIEGMKGSEEDKQRALDIITGTKSANDVVKSLISKHIPKVAVGK